MIEDLCPKIDAACRNIRRCDTGIDAAWGRVSTYDISRAVSTIDEEENVYQYDTDVKVVPDNLLQA